MRNYFSSLCQFIKQQIFYVLYSSHVKIIVRQFLLQILIYKPIFLYINHATKLVMTTLQCHLMKHEINHLFDKGFILTSQILLTTNSCSLSTHHVHTHSLSPSLSDRSEDSLINARCQSRGAQTNRFFDLLEQTYAKKQSKAGGGKNKVSSGKVTQEKRCATYWFLLWFLTQLYVYMHQCRLLYCKSKM